MATTIVDICNMALGWIGTKGITSLSDSSPEAKICLRYLEPARLQVLREHPWNFAQKRATLAEVDVPDEYPEYAYAYLWPADCVTAFKVYKNTAPYDFEVVLSADGSTRMILTTIDTAVLSYTADVSNPALFDPLFAKMLARRLAADIGKAFFKNNPQAVQELETLYINELRRATAKDAGEGKSDPEDEISWITARTTGGAYS